MHRAEPAAPPPAIGADRTVGLPAYPMQALRIAAAEATAAGIDLIGLGVGDPDLPPPPHVAAALEAALRAGGWHGYGTLGGSARLRAAVAGHAARRFGLALDPQAQVFATEGVQGGLAAVLEMLVRPGDGVVVMDPGYAVHHALPRLAQARLLPLPPAPDDAFLAGFAELCAGPERPVAAMLGWPSSPAGLVAGPEFLAALVALARRHGVWLLHDAANAGLWLAGPPPPSLLQAPGAAEVAVEFHSLTKGFGLAGLRLGFALGRPDLIAALARNRSHVEHGPSRLAEAAALAALEGPENAAARATWRARRDCFLGGLAAAGWEAVEPAAGFTVWARVPAPILARAGSEVAAWLIRHAGVAATPGEIFGAAGAGWVRFALVQEAPRLAEAARRLGAALRAAGG